MYVAMRTRGIKDLLEAAEILFIFSGIASRGLPCVGKCHLSKWGSM